MREVVLQFRTSNCRVDILMWSSRGSLIILNTSVFPFKWTIRTVCLADKAQHRIVGIRLLLVSTLCVVVCSQINHVISLISTSINIQNKDSPTPPPTFSKPIAYYVYFLIPLQLQRIFSSAETRPPTSIFNIKQRCYVRCCVLVHRLFVDRENRQKQKTKKQYDSSFIILVRQIE